VYNSHIWCGYEVPETILLRHFIVVMTRLRVFQLAPTNIWKRKRKLCGCCGTDKTCVLLRLVTIKRDQH